MPTQFYVLYAVYGALVGSQGITQAAPVTSQLQAQLNNSPTGVVTINNITMGGDPSPNNLKQFGALVQVNGTILPFACQEHQTINFGYTAGS